MLFRSLAILIALISSAETESPKAQVRVNLVGYLPADTKAAVVFSPNPIDAGFAVIDAKSGDTVLEGKLTPSEASDWGKFEHHYYADFSKVTAEGDYEVRLASGAKSAGSDGGVSISAASASR